MNISQSQTTRVLVVIIIILIAIVFVGYQKLQSVALPYAVSEPVTPQSQLPAGMVLKMFDVPAGAPKPAIAFEISQDSMGGWEVHVDTANFSFTPEHINGEPVSGEGHVHLYIDNNLIIMFGSWYHLASLTPGDHTIRVGLFNNDHSAYAVDNEPVQAEKTIHVGPALNDGPSMEGVHQ